MGLLRTWGFSLVSPDQGMLSMWNVGRPKLASSLFFMLLNVVRLHKLHVNLRIQYLVARRFVIRLIFHRSFMRFREMSNGHKAKLM